MTQQVSITLTGGRIQTYPPITAKVPTTPTTTAKVPTTATTVALAEPPQTFVNPIRLELEALYDEIHRLPLGHPGRTTRLTRWETLKGKLLSGSTS